VGIGRKLLTSALEHARAADGEMVCLQVRHNNESAQKLYRTAGFCETDAEMSQHILRCSAPLPFLVLRLPSPTCPLLYAACPKYGHKYVLVVGKLALNCMLNGRAAWALTWMLKMLKMLDADAKDA